MNHTFPRTTRSLLSAVACLLLFSSAPLSAQRQGDCGPCTYSKRYATLIGPERATQRATIYLRRLPTLEEWQQLRAMLWRIGGTDLDIFPAAGAGFQLSLRHHNRGEARIDGELFTVTGDAVYEIGLRPVVSDPSDGAVAGWMQPYVRRHPAHHRVPGAAVGEDVIVLFNGKKVPLALVSVTPLRAVHLLDAVVTAPQP